MKIKPLCLFIVTIIFTSCVPAPSFVLATPTEFPSPTQTPIPEIPTATLAVVEGFSELDPHTWVTIMPAVREYFYYRQKAIISNNIEEFWAHYPELKNGMDISKGINQEEFLRDTYQFLKPFDGNFFPEQYERLRIKIINDKAEVYVHGMELLLYVDEEGDFQESGGEIRIILFMQKKNNRWVVYKTDEIHMGEPNPFAP
jgi:hypothetical protein